MEALPGLWSLTPVGGLLGFIVLLGYFLATGKLVTRREVDARMAAVEKGHEERATAMQLGFDRVLAEKDSRIDEFTAREERLVARGDDWKAAYDAETETTRVLQGQLLPLNLETMRNFQHLIDVLPIPANGGHTGTQEGS